MVFEGCSLRELQVQIRRQAGLHQVSLVSMKESLPQRVKASICSSLLIEDLLAILQLDVNCRLSYN